MDFAALFGRKQIGLEILDGELKLVEVRRFSQGTQVVAAVRRPLPPGLVAGGAVLNPAALGAELRAAWREGGCRSRRVVLAVPSTQAYCRTIHIPPGRRRAVPAMLDQAVLAGLPIPFPEPVYDCVPVGACAGREQSVLVVAAPSAAVSGLDAAARAAGLRPEAVEVPALALLRVLQIVPTLPPGATALVMQILPDGLDLHFCQGQTVAFSRQVATDLSRYRSARAQEPAGPDPNTIQDVQRFAEDASAVLCQAVQHYLEEADGREAPVSQVRLAGDQPNLPEIAAALARRSDLPVQPLAPMSRLAWPGLPAYRVAGWAVPLGLALRGMAGGGR